MPHVCGDEPLLPTAGKSDGRMPHVCGDEPGYYVMLAKMILYAPRMWG